MTGIFQTLLTHKLPETERKWYHVIMWWEIRRIPYNLILLVSGIISILVMFLIVDGAGDFVSGLAIMGFAFLANFFYTFGWVVEIFLRFFNRHKATWFGLKSFKVGFIIAICGTFVPPLAFGIAGLVRGEKFSSPYSHFAKTEPQLNEIVGTYHIDIKNSAELNEKDKKLTPKIIFNSDSTFTVTNFTYDNFFTYELCNGGGKWKIEKDDGWNAWTIFMSYDSLVNVKTQKQKGSFGTVYFIYNNEPPYKIYCIAGDPDEWKAYIYER